MDGVGVVRWGRGVDGGERYLFELLNVDVELGA